jgi:hypothetical protein
LASERSFVRLALHGMAFCNLGQHTKGWAAVARGSNKPMMMTCKKFNEHDGSD